MCDASNYEYMGGPSSVGLGSGIRVKPGIFSLSLNRGRDFQEKKFMFDNQCSVYACSPFPLPQNIPPHIPLPPNTHTHFKTDQERPSHLKDLLSCVRNVGNSRYFIVTLFEMLLCYY